MEPVEADGRTVAAVRFTLNPRRLWEKGHDEKEVCL